ncbi:MAG: peptidylprolyl isomerase [Leptospirales bacterium]
MKIENGLQVTFEYLLSDEDGENLGDSDTPQTVTYTHGSGEIIHGLESAMAGREPSEKFQVEVPPGHAYGTRNEDLVEVFPRERFDSLEETLQEGMLMEAESTEGNVLFQVTRLTDTEVTVDANHPFAGKVLRFDVQINDVQTIAEEQTDI